MKIIIYSMKQIILTRFVIQTTTYTVDIFKFFKKQLKKLRRKRNFFVYKKLLADNRLQLSWFNEIVQNMQV